jgi:hypothetical protein
MVCITVSALNWRVRREGRVRVIGDHSLGWLEVAEGWGARINVVVYGTKPCPVISSGSSAM